MGYNFFGFSPDAFEQFARALTLQILGPSVEAFGNGPDGGREAIFRGIVQFPNSTNQWSGYGIIQAKCKEKTESTELDQNWALNQLNKELKLFCNNTKRDPKPEYYIFITNVELSSASNGGKDKANRLLQSYYGELPLKGHVVWDANQLTAFLDTYENLRKRFIAFITPGDVLAELFSDMERRRSNIEFILTPFLESELHADEASRLDQAGKRTDEQLQLAQLFFDLPAFNEPKLNPPKEQLNSNGQLPHGVLWEILRNASMKLDPKTLFEQNNKLVDGENSKTSSRYIILGGPGSGKSTIGQFLAQIYRSALLSKREKHLLDPRTHEVIKETQELCDQEGLPWPTTPRFPFRIELTRLAKSMASKETDHSDSLEQYILAQMRCDSSISNTDLIEWMIIFPCILILDGLDEVPSTSNREEVVKAINDFIIKSRQANMDLFILATSREQGYNNEFADNDVCFRYVAPLSIPRALHYVKKYANVRFGKTDPVKAKEIVDKLRESTKRELTAQLMVSPLQVTFMATVVAAKGDPGEDRWQLFDSYYRTIYDRERQKAVPPYDSVLSKQQAIITRLHHDIGFLLQFYGEISGVTAVSLTIIQFEHLVDKYLSELGREGDEKEKMVKLITDAASNRLVFLTSRIAGELSFEVRSLQEYMASECLITGDTEIVQDRLKAIAPITYWRNVFLFAASKCFSDTQARRFQDTIRILCSDLNTDSSSLFGATKVGSELAIDILRSGAVAENPNYSKHLSRIGLNTLSYIYLDSRPERDISFDNKLAAVYVDNLQDIYRENLELHIGQTNYERTYGAWPLLIRLIEKGIDWAITLGERYWKDNKEAAYRIIRQMPNEFNETPWILEKLNKIVWNYPPRETKRILEIIRFSDYRNNSSPLLKLSQLVEGMLCMRIPLKIANKKSGIDILFVPAIINSKIIPDILSTLNTITNADNGWLPFILSYEFLESPTAKTLAKVLRKCIDGNWDPTDKTYLDVLPWPLAKCLQKVRSIKELNELTEKIENGEFGDSNEWKLAEERWFEHGITLNDLIQYPSESLVTHGTIKHFELPAFFNLSIVGEKKEESIILSLFDAIHKINDEELYDIIMVAFCLACHDSGGVSKYIGPDKLKELLCKTHGVFWWNREYIGIPENKESITQCLEFLDWVGNSNFLRLFDSFFDNKDNKKTWCSYMQDYFIKSQQFNFSADHCNYKITSRLGILRMLGRFAANGYSINNIPAELLNRENYKEPRFKFAAILAQLSQESLTDKAAICIADEYIALMDLLIEQDDDNLIYLTVEAHLEHIPALMQFLLRLHKNSRSINEIDMAKCERLLRKTLLKQKSDLQIKGRLTDLDLPYLYEK